jgi:Unconventional myosin tail, actin- and lipid-binding
MVIDGQSRRIEYAKKKDKKAVIKVVKDETVKKDDIYKSHTIHVPSGEPSSSVSRPPAKRKPGVVRPITQGKLLRKGGPSDSVRIFNLQTVCGPDMDGSQNLLRGQNPLPNRCPVNPR